MSTSVGTQPKKSNVLRKKEKKKPKKSNVIVSSVDKTEAAVGGSL